MSEMHLCKICQVNTNEEGNRFVGIQADSHGAKVCFPIGYCLPKTDEEIRNDIRHLIQVLAEFTTKKERLLAARQFGALQTVDFPIHAYQSVLEYYFAIGGRYYVETEHTYLTAPAGKQDWARTVRKHTPLIQNQSGIPSFIYTAYEVRASRPNDTKLITQINRFCVYEAFRKLGWLYVPYMPKEPGAHPDIRTSIAIVQQKLAATNDDRKRMLFQGMKDMLEYMDEETSDRAFYYGVDDFKGVWEQLVDRAFGVRDKERYFPHSRWLLDYGDNRQTRPLQPDTIMIYEGKYYVLDAKCYKYGQSGIPAHLPDASSIHKQITYGEYLEKHQNVDADKLFNAFLMPYNMEENPFGLHTVVGNIGEAVGDWRRNRKYYERIQGIVVDTRHLMYHYAGKPAKEKAELAACIETVRGRGQIAWNFECCNISL